MSQSELQGVTKEDYTELDGSHPMWYRTFQTIPGSFEWYLRIVVDDDGQDIELTFGPLDANKVDHLTASLANTYCHYKASVEAPFESGIAQSITWPYENE